MLEDQNVERYIEQAMKPVLRQIKELKAEVEELKNVLHKSGTVNTHSYKEEFSPDWKGDADDPDRWKGW